MASETNFKFNEETRKELASFMEREKAQAEVDSAIHSFTKMCWKKCISGTPSGTRFSRGEETCLMNCVDRFFDTSAFLVTKIQEKREQ